AEPARSPRRAVRPARRNADVTTWAKRRASAIQCLADRIEHDRVRPACGERVIRAGNDADAHLAARDEPWHHRTALLGQQLLARIAFGEDESQRDVASGQDVEFAA